MPTDMKSLVAEARKQIREISAEDAEKRIADGAVVLDVREPDEYQAGHLPDAINIPRGILEIKVPEHPAIEGTDTPICVCCGSGGRAALSAARLQEMGYTKVTSIAGGFKGWCDSSRPIAAPSADEEE